MATFAYFTDSPNTTASPGIVTVYPTDHSDGCQNYTCLCGYSEHQVWRIGEDRPDAMAPCPRCGRI